MNNATRTATKPFANLNAALDALDVRDLCGHIDLIAADAETAEVTQLEAAADALRCADTVETMDDFKVNLQEAVGELSSIPDAARVSAKITRLLARC